MGYRFSDAGKWQDEWFVDLDSNQKLMFLYLCDTCDAAGFYELSLRRMQFDLCLDSGEVKGALKGLEKAYFLSEDKRVIFIKNFLRHQKNLPLNPLNKMHFGILKRFDIHGGKFGVDLLEFLENQVQKRVKFKGHPGPNGNGNGNILDLKGGAGGKMDFNDFWNLYDKKIGSKKDVEKKWNKLKLPDQEKVMKVLPKWKSQFTDKQYQPYPETFLNQERWNDEILIVGVKDQISKFPNEYSSKFEATLPMNQLQSYWAHLRSLGWHKPEDGRGGHKEWTKKQP